MDRRATAIVFFAALALCALLTKPRVVSWNDGSRIATVDALTAMHRFAVDGSPFAARLGDEIRFRGRTYSDKPPLLAVLGAGVAAAVSPAGVTLRRTPGTAIYLITLSTIGVAFGIGCSYAYALQRLFGATPRLAAAVAALTGAGTLALPYAVIFTNYVPCGTAALAGCYQLARARAGGAPGRWAAAGACFALAYAFDAAGAILAVCAVVLLWGASLRAWALCALAGAPIVALQLAYNRAISGSVVPTVFNATVWRDPSLPLNWWANDIYRVYGPADYAGFVVSLLVGARGLFSFTPIMLLAVYGLVVMVRRGGFERRFALAVSATAVTYFVSIVLLQNDAWSQSFGERRFVELFFLLGVGLGPALDAARSARARALALTAIVVSVTIAALGTVAPFGGAPGQSGLVFGLAEFAALVRRAPVQGALDIVLLIAMLVIVVRLIPPVSALPVSAAAPPRA